jgi:hypothetical protein
LFFARHFTQELISLLTLTEKFSLNSHTGDLSKAAAEALAAAAALETPAAARSKQYSNQANICGTYYHNTRRLHLSFAWGLATAISTV